MITIDLKKNNAYVAESANKYNFPALYISHPSQSAESVERAVLANPCFKGLKVYLQFAPSYIPSNEIRIYDFLPHEHLALADKYGWVVQIHIARPWALPRKLFRRFSTVTPQRFLTSNNRKPPAVMPGANFVRCEVPTQQRSGWRDGSRFCGRNPQLQKSAPGSPAHS